jgi:hypothetical protein
MELLAKLTATLLTAPQIYPTVGHAFEEAQEIMKMAHDEAYKALRHLNNPNAES